MRNGAHHFGADIAGADGVDGNALGCPFLGQRFHKANLASLCGGIISLAHLALLAIDGGDADDTAEAAVAHATPDGLGHVEEGGEIGADDLVPLMGCHLVEHGVTGDAGIVYQYFDGPPVRCHLFQAGGAGFGV